MVLVADELKRKRAEIGAKIEELRAQIASLYKQQGAFDAVIQAYEPGYLPTGAPRPTARRKRQGVDEVSELLKTTGPRRVRRAEGQRCRLPMILNMRRTIQGGRQESIANAWRYHWLAKNIKCDHISTNSRIRD